MPESYTNIVDKARLEYVAWLFAQEGRSMSDLNEVNFTRIRRIRRPSLWRRFLWWLSRHDVAICYGVMVAFSAFMVWYILDAARSGRLPQGW